MHPYLARFLNGPKLEVLQALYDAGEATGGWLGSQVGLPGTSVYGVLKQLESQHFVWRAGRRHVGKRRPSVIYQLTDRTRRLMEHELTEDQAELLEAERGARDSF